jgi:N-acetylneuraminate synthase
MIKDKVYMIGEIGINHNGDLNIAKKLIDAVNACNWDCAKFQKRNPDVCVPEAQKSVMRETPWGKMTYLDYKYRVEFESAQYNDIDRYCAEKPVDWTASVWDLDSLKFIQNYQVPFIKIPSALITDSELLRACAETKIPLMISTGMSTLTEIDEAVNIILKVGVNPIVMHCNSSYPAKHDELNLSLIPFLKDRYDCQIGYSGHEEDLEPSVVAVALGATVIERHITLDHNMWGTDHKSSLEVMAMDILRKRISVVRETIGIPEKIVTDSEKEIRAKLRK